MKLKLSIVTINYNNSNGLYKTIKSVISQTYLNFEYIIIDGASTDGSLDLLRQYSDKINYWSSEPDTGIYNAMNKGILIAKGEYILFLNSGDYLFSDNILSEIFDNNYKEDIISGEVITYSIENQKAEIYSNFDINNNTLFDFLNSSPNHQATFIRRELFNEYGLYDESFKMVSDYGFFIKSVGLGKASFKFIKKKISYFNVDGESFANKKLGQIERQMIVKKLLPQRVYDDYMNNNIGKMRIIKKYLLSNFLFKILLYLTRKYASFNEFIKNLYPKSYEK